MQILEIVDTDDLYRRIHPNNVKPDGTLSSAAFKGSDAYYLSVDLAHLSTPEQTFSRAATYGSACAGVAAFTAGQARTQFQQVRHDLIEDEDNAKRNPAHTLIIGAKLDPIATRLARYCRWIYRPALS